MRLNKLYKQAITHEEIISCLEPILENYSVHREPKEKFGDFCIRTGLVQPTTSGTDNDVLYHYIKCLSVFLQDPRRKTHSDTEVNFNSIRRRSFRAYKELH